MKKLKILHKTDVNGGPVSGQHVNLLHQKTTADDDDIYPFFRNSPSGQTLRRIFACDGSNDAVSCKDVPFGG